MEHVDHILELFDLQEKGDSPIRSYSTGQKKKIAICSALVTEAPILILDEPFSGLDPVNIELVKDIILEKQKEGVTIIFSTHLMDYAEKIVDSVVMINQGKKVLEGELNDVRTKFGNKILHLNYSGDSNLVKKLDNIKKVSDYGNEM